MAKTKKSTGSRYEIGFAEGAEAGNLEMVVSEQNFGRLEDALAMGHAMLWRHTPPFVAASQSSCLARSPQMAKDFPVEEPPRLLRDRLPDLPGIGPGKVAY